MQPRRILCNGVFSDGQSCVRPALYPCTRCGDTAYCSQKCTASDLRSHNLVCRQTRPERFAALCALVTRSHASVRSYTLTEQFTVTVDDEKHCVGHYRVECCTCESPVRGRLCAKPLFTVRRGTNQPRLSILYAQCGGCESDRNWLCPNSFHSNNECAIRMHSLAYRFWLLLCAMADTVSADVCRHIQALIIADERLLCWDWNRPWGEKHRVYSNTITSSQLDHWQK